MRLWIIVLYVSTVFLQLVLSLSFSLCFLPRRNSGKRMKESRKAFREFLSHIFYSGDGQCNNTIAMERFQLWGTIIFHFLALLQTKGWIKITKQSPTQSLMANRLAGTSPQQLVHSTMPTGVNILIRFLRISFLILLGRDKISLDSRFNVQISIWPHAGPDLGQYSGHIKDYWSKQAGTALGETVLSRLHTTHPRCALLNGRHQRGSWQGTAQLLWLIKVIGSACVWPTSLLRAIYLYSRTPNMGAAVAMIEWWMHPEKGYSHKRNSRFSQRWQVLLMSLAMFRLMSIFCPLLRQPLVMNMWGNFVRISVCADEPSRFATEYGQTFYWPLTEWSESEGEGKEQYIKQFIIMTGSWQTREQYKNVINKW